MPVDIETRKSINNAIGVIRAIASGALTDIADGHPVLVPMTLEDFQVMMQKIIDQTDKLNKALEPVLK